MKCPLDQTQLVMSARQGVEIDYCPECRGVWLDRGELDKIIERSTLAAEPMASDADSRRGAAAPGSDSARPPRKRKKESFLSDLFDF
jgi:hypothetical protein